MEAGVLDRLGQNTQDLCAVCGDQADGYHYGALSCRGCNAFFRRAVNYNLQFTCRRGGSCIIDKNARCACRACRLKKCKMVGMDRAAVQQRHKDPDAGIKKEPKTFQSLPTEPILSDSDRSSPRVDTMVVISEADVMPNSFVVSNFLPLTMNFPSTTMTPPPMGGLYYAPNALNAADPIQNGFLSVLVLKYHEQRRRRHTLLCKTLEEILSDDSETILKGPATTEDLIAIYSVQMSLMFEWVENFEEFKEIIDPIDKVKLLRAFSMKYLLLDNLLHTIELNYDDRIVFVNNTFLQYGNFPQTEIDTLESQKALHMMYGDSCIEIIHELLKPMHDMNITYGEVLALRMIMLWNPGSIGLTAQTVEIITRASEKAIKELQNWFELNKMDEGKTRIANLLILLTPLAKHTAVLAEISSSIPGFGNMPEWDLFMSDLLRGYT